MVLKMGWNGEARELVRAGLLASASCGDAFHIWMVETMAVIEVSKRQLSRTQRTLIFLGCVAIYVVIVISNQGAHT